MRWKNVHYDQRKNHARIVVDRRGGDGRGYSAS
jgi:hypothetical protein